MNHYQQPKVAKTDEKLVLLSDVVRCFREIKT